MKMVEITKSDGAADVEINNWPFDKQEAEKIRTRIERNSFKGDYSSHGLHGGITVIRDGDVLKLAKPAETPRQSWSYRDWVEFSDGWTVYAEGTQEEWVEAFNSA